LIDKINYPQINILFSRIYIQIIKNYIPGVFFYLFPLPPSPRGDGGKPEIKIIQVPPPCGRDIGRGKRATEDH
jgi:hypothetical protein